MLPNRIWLLIILLASLLFFNSCTSRYSLKSSNTLLSAERASARTSSLSIQIPVDWREVDANDTTFIDLWLVNEENNLSLSLIPLNSEGKTNLQNWITTSKLLNKMKFKLSDNDLTNEDLVEINGTEFIIYNFYHQSSFYRISIFKFKNKFYELTAYLDNSKGKISDKKSLIDIQNAALASIR